MYLPRLGERRHRGAGARLYAEDELVYAGRVGTGWSDATWRLPFTQRPRCHQGRQARLLEPLLAGAEKGVVWTGAAPRVLAKLRTATGRRTASSARPRSRVCATISPLEEITLGITPARRRATTPRPTEAAMIKLTHPERILWPEFGHHQTGPRRLLRRDRRLDSAPCGRPGGEPGTPPFRNRHKGLFRQASVGRIEQCGAAHRRGRTETDAGDRGHRGTHRFCPSRGDRNPIRGARVWSSLKRPTA